MLMKSQEMHRRLRWWIILMTLAANACGPIRPHVSGATPMWIMNRGAETTSWQTGQLTDLKWIDVPADVPLGTAMLAGAATGGAATDAIINARTSAALLHIETNTIKYSLVVDPKKCRISAFVVNGPAAISLAKVTSVRKGTDITCQAQLVQQQAK
jgi:hypothetical protein